MDDVVRCVNILAVGRAIERQRYRERNIHNMRNTWKSCYIITHLQSNHRGKKVILQNIVFTVRCVLSSCTGLPVLTVQSLAIGKTSECKEHTGEAVTSLSLTHPPSLSPTVHNTPQLHNVHVLLETTNSSPSSTTSQSSLTFSPVLIWQPGSSRHTSSTLPHDQHRLRQTRHVTMKTHNLTDSLPPERLSSSRSSSKEKVITCCQKRLSQFIIFFYIFSQG